MSFRIIEPIEKKIKNLDYDIKCKLFDKYKKI